jgi:hypothetical protein
LLVLDLGTLTLLLLLLLVLLLLLLRRSERLANVSRSRRRPLLVLDLGTLTILLLLVLVLVLLLLLRRSVRLANASRSRRRSLLVLDLGTLTLFLVLLLLLRRSVRLANASRSRRRLLLVLDLFALALLLVLMLLLLLRRSVRLANASRSRPLLVLDLGALTLLLVLLVLVRRSLRSMEWGWWWRSLVMGLELDGVVVGAEETPVVSGRVRDLDASSGEDEAEDEETAVKIKGAATAAADWGAAPMRALRGMGPNETAIAADAGIDGVVVVLVVSARSSFSPRPSDDLADSGGIDDGARGGVPSAASALLLSIIMSCIMAGVLGCFIMAMSHARNSKQSEASLSSLLERQESIEGSSVVALAHKIQNELEAAYIRRIY